MLDRLLRALQAHRVDGQNVRQWSVYSTENRRLTLGTKDRETGSVHAPLHLSESRVARFLIVWEDGLVSRGALERRQIEQEPERALEQARRAAYCDPDAAAVLGPASMPETLMHDAESERVSSGDTTLLAERLDRIRARFDDGAFRTWSGSLSAASGHGRIVTSAGLAAEASGTAAAWHVVVDGEIGEGHRARRFEPADAFDDRLERLERLALELRRPTDPPRGGVHPVLLHPHVVEDLVLPTLLHNLQGSTVAHGEGFFKRSQFGSDAPVLREDLSLRHDPLLPLRSGSYRFTVEGIPAAPMDFIRDGRLKSPILDLKYSRRLKLPPTPAPAGMDTLFLESGDGNDPPKSLSDVCDAVASGFLVLNVLGVHTQDASSGDFSLSAPQTLTIRGGRLAGRLRATISGNLFALLRRDDLRLLRFEGEVTPGLLVRCRLDPESDPA